MSLVCGVDRLHTFRTALVEACFAAAVEGFGVCPGVCEGAMLPCLGVVCSAGNENILLNISRERTQRWMRIGQAHHGSLASLPQSRENFRMVTAPGHGSQSRRWIF